MRSTRVFLFILAVGMVSGAMAADEPAMPVRPSTETILRTPPPGEITAENYGLRPEGQEGLGVRVARIVRREELPGGPWASGEIGDYLLENEFVRVVVRGENRPARTGVGGTGNIVDVAMRDRMWDCFGTLSQFARAGDLYGGIVYDKIEMKAAKPPRIPPSLVAFGRLGGEGGFPVFTVIQPVPHQPQVAVKTYLTNTGSTTQTVHVATKVLWGGLAVFSGDFGIPPMLRPVRFRAPWVCGILDDFAMGIVRMGGGPDAETMINQNETFMPYGSAEIGPGQTAQMDVALLFSRADTAPFNEFYLASRNLPRGMVEGVIREQPGDTPIADAEIEVTRIHARDEAANGDAVYPLPAHAVTRSNAQGHYRIYLAPGEYALQCRTVGRSPSPPFRMGFRVEANQVVRKDMNQIMPNFVTCEAVDAATSEPLPAKIRFLAVPPNKIDLGPPWQAHGGRDSYYLKPGPNRIAINGGTYRCVVSRGPEYDTWQETVNIEYGKPLSIRATLRRLTDTPGWTPVGLAMATEASPSSRVSASDLALAAAGEGLEWIVSGDLGRITDLSAAIDQQGLQRFVHASRGIHLSYQHARLFGEFYLFPLPADATQKQIDSLADEKTTPERFFKNVRKAFPGALICVLDPAAPTASYLCYYGGDHVSGQAPSGKYFSDAFDAIVTYDGKEQAINEAGWNMWSALAHTGAPKLVLAASRTPSLHYSEPGYPRVYVQAPEGVDPARMSDAQLIESIRAGAYYLTNGPLIGLKMEERWPAHEQAKSMEKFAYTYRVEAAPWVKVAAISVNRNNRPREQHLVQNTEKFLRFPREGDWTKPQTWDLSRHHRKTGELIREDIYFHIEVTGFSLHPVVSQNRGLATGVYAVTPPVLFDADGDGKYRF